MAVAWHPNRDQQTPQSPKGSTPSNLHKHDSNSPDHEHKAKRSKISGAVGPGTSIDIQENSSLSKNSGMASYQEILKSKYPAKEHAQRVADYIVKHGGDPEGVIYLEGQKTRMIEDNDEPCPFRQRRYFHYLTGCDVPDCFYTYDMKNQKSTLFIPPINPDDVVWSGLPLTVDAALKEYDVDDVKLSTEVNPHLADSTNPQSTVYAIPNQVSDDITFLSFNEKSFDVLKSAIETCRVTKSDYEIALLMHANDVSTAAHIAVMQAAKNVTNECELEALFIKSCIERGCKEQSYHGIFAAGTSAATLHYVKNNAPLAGKQLLLADAGCESRTYCADITRTFPISGQFTPEARSIYDIVLRMQSECMSLLKAGVLWDDVHAHAHKVAIKGLLNLGILKGGDVETIFKNRTSVAFFPHGLGHYLGMDTHDCGGNPNYADKDPMFRYLRVRGTLPAGSVITVEPGIYFCRFIIEPYLNSEEHGKYIDDKVLEKYWDVGGVRIEDDVLVTETGFEDLTSAPKTVEELETILNSRIAAHDAKVGYADGY